MLEQRQKLENFLLDHGQPIPEHPLVDISGKVEGNAYSLWPYAGDQTGDIDLASAQLDVAAQINSWATAFMSLKYDPSAPFFLVQRSANSRVFLENGFLTIGSFNHSPFYFTMGQVFVPFGRYSSHMLSAPLPFFIGRTKARVAMLGYRQGADGFYGSIYGFRGDSFGPSHTQGGANLGYRYVNDRVNLYVASGLIANIADAGGMQAAAAAGFIGFGATPATQMLEHRVPGFDIHGGLSVGKFDFIAEFLTATRAFSIADMTFNGDGARPKAFNLEGAYHFGLFGHPSSIAVGYGHSSEALALGLPRHRFIVAVNTSFWRDTIETLEFRHDENYAVGSTASGAAIPVLIAPGTLGESMDIITGQVSVYF